ncbi:unnamed protein product [Pneumocystis jirovecii]|uniref:Uncharacterized protein n=1 Tax=Pneumocystis jirovecii TaxID=42068 RepID=L0PCW1_PNEJI|nr:unnamed protein product [Pneumocystis jirovecii]
MKIWGSDMGKKGSFMLNDDELISSLTKMGKTETASWYMDEIEEAEKIQTTIIPSFIISS